MPIIKGITVLVKKGIVTPKMNSAQITYGASASLLPGENWQNEAIKLSTQIKTMLAIELPTKSEKDLLITN